MSLAPLCRCELRSGYDTAINSSSVLQETIRLTAIPSVAFGQAVGLEGTSAVQRSWAESKRRQLLTPCTVSCRTLQIAPTAFEADPLPLARRPNISLSL